MKPSFLSKRVFYQKGSILLMLLLSINACVDDNVTNISDNVMVDQSFSIPIGAKEARIEKPAVSSNTPGPYGTFYYDQLPYPINDLIWILSDTLNFNLSTNPNSNRIKKITFNIITKNSYFLSSTLQVYLIGAGDHVLDSFFKPEALPTTAESRSYASVVYEGTRLDSLKQTKTLKYEIRIKYNFTNVNLSDENKFRVTIGARAELEYNIKDLN